MDADEASPVPPTARAHHAPSKHLKGQLDPPVGNGNVFWTKGGQLDPPVGNGNVFCIKGGQLDPPVAEMQKGSSRNVK